MVKLISLATVFLVTSIVTSTAQNNPLVWSVIPQAFADQYGAACLDGSPPGLYTYLQDPAKWVIFIEGGGWSFDTTVNGTILNAAQRAMGGGGSSKYNGGSLVVGGQLSTDPSINPHFYNHSLVFIHYCDGTSHSSNSALPVPVPAEMRQILTEKARYEMQYTPETTEFRTVNVPSQVYFRGRSNLLAVLNYLKQNTSISTATDIVVSGGSAGATSAYLALDILPAVFPSSKVMGAPDAGFFLDAYNVGQQIMWYRTCFQAADQVWNSTGSGGVNARCLQAYPNATWKCFIPQYYAAMIQTPYIILNSAYDMWQILNDLQIGCVPSMDGKGASGIGPCNSSQMDIVQAYRTSQLQAVAPALAVSSTGIFIDSCFVHETNVDYCSSQSLPNCIGWNIYNISIPNPIVSVSVNMDQTMYTWYSATLNNWDNVVRERQAFMDNVVDPAIAAGRDVNEAARDHYSKTTGYNLAANNNIPITRFTTKGTVQVIDSVEFPNNPSCPFPTPSPVPRSS